MLECGQERNVRMWAGKMIKCGQERNVRMWAGEKC